MADPLAEFSNHLLEAWNSHDIEAIMPFYAPGFVGEDVAQATKLLGRDSLRETLARYFSAFPDLQITPLDVVIQEDRIVQIWRAGGTHSGHFMHIPPSGRQVTMLGATFLRIRNSQVVEATLIWDLAGLLRSMGLLPDL